MDHPHSPFVQNQRPWWRYVGPWPLRPLLMFVITWYFFIVTTVGAITVSTQVGLRSFLAEGMVQGVASAIPMGLTLWVGKRWQQRFGIRVTSYIFFILFAVVLVISARYALFVSDVVEERGASSLVFAVFRLTMLVLVASALAGAVTERLQRQVAATTAALEISRRQQEQILQADENARRQVAEILHDRVQAGLITACLELQSLPENEEQRRNIVAATIRHLEALRSIDVKRAVRALSPSLQDVDLHAALRELGAQYQPAMITTVDVPVDVERGIRDPEVRLALYRVTEQALMNAATHGRARNVYVNAWTADDSVVLEVGDDGVGLGSQNMEEGLGSALITTWARKLGGSWSLTNQPGSGARLRMVIPRDHHSVEVS